MNIMTSTISPMVLSILALRPDLLPVTDELRNRVQSIRVRSAQETQGHSSGQSWRQRVPTSTGTAAGSGTGPSSGTNRGQQSQQGLGGRWRNSTGNMSHSSSNNSLNSPTTPTSPPPFRFSNTAPNQLQLKPVHRAPSFNTSTPTPTAGTPSFTNTNSPAPMRYISKFHNGSKTGDDQILNTVILNKLNVFSIKTYDDVKQFLFQILGSDQKEFIREFTWLVFRKAAAEDKFCALFAKLLSEIKREYPVILEEMRNLHTTYLEIWDIKETPDSKVDRRCRLGYSQFLAELTALGILEPDMMRATLETLKACIVKCLPTAEYKETIEEYMDCLRQLCSSKIPKAVREMIREVLVADLESWISTKQTDIPGLSNKSRFACMDLRDSLLKSA
jgi:hypothetical protein